MGKPPSAALEARFNHAAALHRQGRLKDASHIYHKLLRHDPHNAAALYLLGVVALQTGRAERAAELIARSLALNPDQAEAHCNQAIALQMLGRSEQALASYDRAIALQPGYAEAYNNRGNTLHALHHPDQLIEELACFDKAIALRPDYAEAYSNRGNALQSMRCSSEAIASYDKAIELNPRHADALYNKSLCLLQAGDLAGGWPLYEWRKRRGGSIAARPYPQPAWTGEQDIAGKTLFAHWEQGFGDTIQFCRYAALAAARGARVILEVQTPLLRLLRHSLPMVEVIGQTQAPERFDFHASLLSLPLAFRTALETVPADTPYLRADEQRHAQWALRLPPARPAIGLVWSGSAGHSDDRSRSMEPGAFLPLLDAEATWISLQKDIRDGDQAMLQRIVSFSHELHDFSDTATLLDNLDLVITVDTSVAHLAGAMGKPVWILLAYNPDWRWLLDRSDSPWYPTARLFRQPTPGDWDSVIGEVRAALSNLL